MIVDGVNRCGAVAVTTGEPCLRRTAPGARCVHHTGSDDRPVWRVYRGELTGCYYAARMRHDGDRWEAVEKHDVTDDIEQIVAERTEP